MPEVRHRKVKLGDAYIQVVELDHPPKKVDLPEGWEALKWQYAEVEYKDKNTDEFDIFFVNRSERSCLRIIKAVQPIEHECVMGHKHKPGEEYWIVGYHPPGTAKIVGNDIEFLVEDAACWEAKDEEEADRIISAVNERFIKGFWEEIKHAEKIR
jgi:hypothetical protein